MLDLPGREEMIGDHKELIPSDFAEFCFEVRQIIHNAGMVPVPREIMRTLARKGVRSTEEKIRRSLAYMGWNPQEKNNVALS